MDNGARSRRYPNLSVRCRAKKDCFFGGSFMDFGVTLVGGTAEEVKVYLVERDDVTDRDRIAGFEVRGC